MNPGDLMTFHAPSRDRECLPVLLPDVVGREVNCADQKAVFRCVGGDRVRVVEVRSDKETVLVSHAAVLGGVLLTSARFLTPCPLQMQ